MEEKLEVIYEWCVEELDDYGDIAENHYLNELNEVNPLLDYLRAQGKDANHNLVLVRSVGNDAKGMVDRKWAYVENNALPNKFTDSDYKVPERYQDELKKWLKTL